MSLALNDKEMIIAKNFIPELTDVDTENLFTQKTTNKKKTTIPFFSGNPNCSNRSTPSFGGSKSKTPALEEFIDWLKNGFSQKIVPTNWFDENFYLEMYPDVRDNGIWAFEHYLLYGISENRLPNSIIPDCAPQKSLDERYKNLQFNGLDIDFLSSIPNLLDDPSLIRIIAEGNSENIVQSLKKNKKLSFIFDSKLYRRSIETYYPELYIPPNMELEHWIRNGRHLSAQFNPLFNIEFYKRTHKDLSFLSNEKLTTHFLNHGLFENRRSSILFSAAEYAKKENLKTGESGVIRALKEFKETGEIFQNQTSLNIPKGFLNKLAALETHMEGCQCRILDDEISDQLKKVQAFEPRVNFDTNNRNVSFPLIQHSSNKLHFVSKQFRDKLRNTKYKAIVLIPHCRMSGAARVSGALAGALEQYFGPENLCIISTDSSTLEHPEWFPKSVDILDISEDLVGLSPEEKRLALTNLVRATQSEFIFNVNSRLAWLTIDEYGKQISTFCKIYSYLFCSDISPVGLRTGYPQEFFRSTLEHHSNIFVDNESLKNELIFDHLLPQKYQDKIQVTPSPYSPDINTVSTAKYRSSFLTLGAKKIFWAGRFDRQKNFDLLKRIASELPKHEFWVWGKPVLETTSNIEKSDLPENIRLQGEYTKFSDLPLNSCDLWLYTSKWEGLPTLLIDVAASGIPIVATSVGGIPELLKCSQIFLVNEINDTKPYVEKINHLLNDGRRARKEALRLKDSTLRNHSKEQFTQKIHLTLKSHTK